MFELMFVDRSGLWWFKEEIYIYKYIYKYIYIWIYMGVTVIVKLATNGLRNWLEVRYFFGVDMVGFEVGWVDSG